MREEHRYGDSPIAAASSGRLLKSMRSWAGRPDVAVGGACLTSLALLIPGPQSTGRTPTSSASAASQPLPTHEYVEPLPTPTVEAAITPTAVPTVPAPVPPPGVDAPIPAAAIENEDKGNRPDQTPLQRVVLRAPSVGPIEDYAAGQYQQGCEPKERPGVVSFRDMTLTRYPHTGSSGIVRDCHKGGTSEHKEGRAWDWKVDVNDPKQKAAADEMIGWLLATDAAGNPHANARRLGVMYIIWNRQIWSAARPADGFRPYRGKSAHTDHVHVSFDWAGALRRTSYWTGRRSGRVPPPTDLPTMPPPPPPSSSPSPAGAPPSPRPTSGTGPPPDPSPEPSGSPSPTPTQLLPLPDPTFGLR